MYAVKFRKKIAFAKWLITVGFVIVSLFLIYLGFFVDGPTERKVISVPIGIIGILFFGMHCVRLFSVLLSKDTTLFRFDTKKIYCGEGTTWKGIAWQNIIDMKQTQGIASSYYLFHCKGAVNFLIATHYLLTEKENTVISEMLNKLISQNGQDNSIFNPYQSDISSEIVEKIG